MVKNEKGLTLIELLSVIVILAIITAIAVPSISNIIDNSRYNAIKEDAISVLNAAKLYFADHPNANYVTSGYLLGMGYLEREGRIPGAKITDEVDRDSFGSDPTVGLSQSRVDFVQSEYYLNTNSIYYSGTKTFSGIKTVGFSNATITHIAKDKQKGSSDGEKYIGKEANNSSN